MFHVKHRLYIRTELTIPGAGVAVHIAELEERDERTCSMLRLIELAPDDTIMGAAGKGKKAGAVTAPNDVVPHPSTYHEYDGLQATHLSEAEFTALWSEAQAKFPDLG
ncbi:hypothetical protein [Corynebacterium tapiri]|uniref:Uncharacterized protein n=1 Tax=Corynebacterium tapiri TaxID=1448266 RepID=A0A5C4U3A1_9CORY|nr:hypothetical protein [Corynebacterium tapiri]TNL96873.1 hypothetical protein FHE74_07615 [Corynebacterium tapiri]